MVRLGISRRPLQAGHVPLYLYRGLRRLAVAIACAAALAAAIVHVHADGATTPASRAEAAPAQVDERPLPDARAFGAEVRRRFREDRELQSEYTYVERREELRVTPLGQVTEGPVKVYEVYPSREPGGTYKRLIAVDGVPLTPAELEKADRKHRADLKRERERRARETPSERTRRLEKEAEERRKLAAVLEEIFDAYRIRLVGREVIDGHLTVLATLDPKPEHRPKSDEGRLMKKLRARAWVSESDYQIVRAEVDVIEDLTVAWGIVGRVHAGTRGVFERRKINNEVWLPSREWVKGSGRALLFRTFQVNTVTEYSDYRRVSAAERERVTAK